MSDTDALAALRRAIVAMDPRGFADCFAPEAWFRVPRPEGDVVLSGRREIEQIGHELRDLISQVSWTPSQRFVAAGQVVEEAVARARTVPGVTGSGPDGEIRLPMRVVAVVNPVGMIDNLTLWVDWAALDDPHGVRSARGAASALVAQARAQDARGLRVIVEEPATGPIPVTAAAPPTPPTPLAQVNRSTRPSPLALWWRSHRFTLAGSVMAVAAAAVIGWVAIAVLQPITRSDLNAAQQAAAPPDSDRASEPAARTIDQPAADDIPVVTEEDPDRKPTVQAGQQYDLESDLLFRSDSTELTDEALTRIQAVAEQVRKAKVSGTIQVNGYTDSRGSKAYNVRLSNQRARAVAEALAEQLKGLPVRLTPQGFGEDGAVATNSTPEGRRMNRHVTVVLPTLAPTQ